MTTMQSIENKLGEINAQIKTKTAQWSKYISDKAGDAYDKAGEMGTAAKDKAGEMGTAIKDKAGEMGTAIKEKTGDMGTAIKDKAGDASDSVNKNYEKAKAASEAELQDLNKQRKEMMASLEKIRAEHAK